MTVAERFWIALNRPRNWYSNAMFAAVITTGGLLATGSILFWCNQEPATRDAVSMPWSVYSKAAFDRTELEGKPVAVLYFANWALSADPKGGLSNPGISQALADAGFVLMTADLTHSDANDFDELRHLGFNSVPMLILYPQTGPPVGFDGGTPESNVVAAVELIGG